jgi:hypothetical protein
MMSFMILTIVSWTCLVVISACDSQKLYYPQDSRKLRARGHGLNEGYQRLPPAVTVIGLHICLSLVVG